MPPGGDEAQVAFIPGTSASYVGFHALMSVPLDRAAIERIGMREGWRTRFFGRGAPGKPPAFHLLEFWVENKSCSNSHCGLLAEYTDYMQIERMDAIMRDRVAATAR